VSLAARLEGALAAAAHALAAGDAALAEEAAALAASVCEEARKAGGGITPAERDRLLEAYRRAEAAAVGARQELSQKLSKASLGRRASHAYRR